MKVLVISAAFPPHRSGEATNAYCLSQELASRGVDVHVLTTTGAAAPSAKGVSVHAIMDGWSWLELPRLRRFVRGCAPDAVLLMYIGWTYKYHFMITFAPTFVKALLPGVPFVTRFENVMGADPRHTTIFARLVRKALALGDRHGKVNYGFGTLLRDSNRIIVLSEAHRLLLSECLPGIESKITLIPPSLNMRLSSESNGAARRHGRERLGLEENHIVIAYIGYIHAGKGLDTLLRAFQLVAQPRAELRLLMIGGAIAAESGNPEGYLHELLELAGQLGMADRVKWTGEFTWDREDASLYLRAADVCVLPFRRGIHLNNSSLASVAAHGLPIIATRGDFLEDAFVHGHNVLLCPPESPQALAAAITAVVDDPRLQQRLRAGSLQLAQEWFSWERAIQRTLETFGMFDQAFGCGGA